MIKLFLKILFLIGVIQLISACNADDKNVYKVFHYNQHNSIGSLDPAFAKSQNNIWPVNHLFDGLVQLDDELNVIPAVAKDWSISNDGKSYTFSLRKDVYFHDNQCFKSDGLRHLIASDVVYSLNRIISDEVNSPGSWIFKGLVAELEPFTAIDDSTVLIQLQKPFLPFLGILTMEYCSIVPHEAIDYYGKDFRKNPVGCGPFYFKKWLENQGLFLLANENYYDSLTQAKYDGIRTSFISDKNIAMLELQKGNIDFSSGLQSSFINDFLDKEGNLLEAKRESLSFYKSPYLNTEYIGINLDLASNSILKDKRVRQALNYAIDKELMLLSLRNNVGKPANSGITPIGLPSFDATKAKGYSYDLVKAKSLIDSAGISNSEMTLTINTNSDYVDICTFIAKQWETLGFKTEIELMDSAILRDGMRKSKVSMFRASWIADYPDAESFFSMFYSENPAPPNYTRFSNTLFDKIYKKSLAEVDEQRRYDLYQQLDKILIEEAPVIFLFYDETALFANNKIENLSLNALNMLKAKQLIVQ